MGNLVVFPPKHPNADFISSVDMSPLLAAGEAVVGATVETSLILGVDDPFLNLVTSGSASLYQNVITQTLVGGYPGNTYCVRYTASTNQGNALITLANLSILTLNTE